MGLSGRKRDVSAVFGKVKTDSSPSLSRWQTDIFHSATLGPEQREMRSDSWKCNINCHTSAGISGHLEESFVFVPWRLRRKSGDCCWAWLKDKTVAWENHHELISRNHDTTPYCGH